jgi:hypothetical protein
MQDVEVGRPEFDKAFLIQGNDEAKMRALFANPRIRELIQAQPQVAFGIIDNDGWGGVKFPDGVDELYFMLMGIVADVERLKSLVDLLTETLNHLCYADDADKDEITLLIETLRAPGGQIKDGNFVLWDGDAPRREAAEELGRLKNAKAVEPLTQVLNDADKGLREKSAWALGEIGDRRIVPALIPLLGDEAKNNRGNFSGRSPVADALRKLGKSELVEAFSQALFHSKTAMQSLKDYRREFGQAFIRALGSPDVSTAVNAAWALSELGTLEALPHLRSQRHALRFPNPQLKEIWDQAIATLQSLSALPRAADATTLNAETLPRTAGAPEPNTETLPRAADK